jgi:serine/threonine protein kinase
MGAVYLARLETLGNKQVAIKEMRIAAMDETTQQQAVKQFQQEARFLANLEHPNLVDVSDYFCQNERHYLVMAYVKGHTLAEALAKRREPFEVLTVLEWALQLTSVLGYLHNQDPPIMFRDLKPSNIMLEGGQKIRLIDFGIARSYSPESVTATFLQGTGSSGYSPMEQYQGGGTTDPRSDIYSLGATLYHLLTNRIPPSPVEVVSDGADIPSPQSLNSRVNPALDRVLLKMLSLRKDDRQVDIAQVASQLRSIYVALQQSSQATEALSSVITALATQPSSNKKWTAPVQATVIQVASPPKDPNEKYIWMVVAALCMVLMLFSGWMFSRLPSFQASPQVATASSPAATPVILASETSPNAGKTLAISERPRISPKPDLSRPKKPQPVPRNSVANPNATQRAAAKNSAVATIEVPSLPEPSYPKAPIVATTKEEAARHWMETAKARTPVVDPDPKPLPKVVPSATPTPAAVAGPYNPYANLKDWPGKDNGFPPPVVQGFGPPVPDGKGGWIPDPVWKPGQEDPRDRMHRGPFSSGAQTTGPGQGPRSNGGPRW